MLADEQARAITSCPASENFPGITDVLYLENYEELTNLMRAIRKTVILTHKSIFCENQVPRNFQEGKMGADRML